MAEEMATVKAGEPAHPVYSCVTTLGKYCSTECDAMEKAPEIDCVGRHAGYKGKTS